MLRGHVFSEQIFGVNIFALFVNQFLGGNNGVIEDYKNAMAMTNTTNSITVDTGVCVIQGRYLEEHTGSIINYAKEDNLYCSLVIEIDLGKTNTKTSLLQAYYKVLEGESDYPTLIQNDIANEDGNIYQFELARFQNGPAGISNFTDKRTFLSFDSVYSGIIQNNLNSDSTTSALSAKQGKLLGGYSETETIVGTWIDGKPLYRKTIDLGNLPNNSTKTVATGLNFSTDCKCRKIEGIAIYANGLSLPMPYVSANYPIVINIDSSNRISVQTNNDRSGATGYAIIEYTKNND